MVKGHPRFVIDRNRITGAAFFGLDEALKLVELLSSHAVAQQVQQSIQYYPRPPVNSKIPAAQGCPLTVGPGKMSQLEARDSNL